MNETAVAPRLIRSSPQTFRSDARLISFRHLPTHGRINVYYTTHTVGTAIDHPRAGKTQLFRRNVNLRELLEIFM